MKTKENFFTVESQLFGKNVIYEISGELLPSMSHEEALAHRNVELKNGGFYTPTVPEIFSFASGAIMSYNRDLINFTSEKLLKNALITSTTIGYKADNYFGKIIHAKGIFEKKVSDLARVVGKNFYFKDGGDEFYIVTLTGFYPDQAHAILNCITGRDVFLSRVNSPIKKDSEIGFYICALMYNFILDCYNPPPKDCRSFGIRIRATDF